MRRVPLALALATIISLTGAVHADDSFNYDGISYSGTIVGQRDGKLVATLGSTDRSYDLDKVLVITLSANENFTNAEIVRATDVKKAAALYKEAISSLNSPALKQLAKLRAIQPTAQDGKWLDAVGYFLDVYQAFPVDAVWKVRPTHMPDPGSSMLKDSTDRIAAVAKTIRTDEARKNLQSFERDILNQAGDTAAAGRLAREAATGIAEDPPAPSPSRPVDAAAQSDAGLAEMEAAIRAKDYDGAIKRAEARLDTASPDLSVQLFRQEARVYQEENKPELAIAALLRISAHYPSSPEVPAALLEAGTLEKSDHPAAAKALFQEIVEKFPNSKEAVIARTE